MHKAQASQQHFFRTFSLSGATISFVLRKEPIIQETEPLSIITCMSFLCTLFFGGGEDQEDSSSLLLLLLEPSALPSIHP